MACNCTSVWPAAPGGLGAGVASIGPGGIPYQVREFEPAFYTPHRVYTLQAYSPATVAAISPVFTGGLPPSQPCSTCCNKAYSPLPPNAVQAWASAVGCGGTCVTSAATAAGYGGCAQCTRKGF